MAIEDPKRALLRHTVATVAYRGAKVLRGVPPEFGKSGLGQGIRAPIEILSHIADLFEWATHLAEGRQVWNEGPPDTWEAEVERFFRELGRFDAVLASNRALHCEAERLFQGPIADALTHSVNLPCCAVEPVRRSVARIIFARKSRGESLVPNKRSRGWNLTSRSGGIDDGIEAVRVIPGATLRERMSGRPS